MLSDFLLEVLLLRQGPRISEDATFFFGLRKTRGDFVVDWREFVAFEAEPQDYIFKKDIKNSFIEKIDAQLSVIDRVKLELNAEQYNSEICFRYESVLKTVKEVLEQSVQSENVFLKRW